MLWARLLTLEETDIPQDIEHDQYDLENRSDPLIISSDDVKLFLRKMESEQKIN